MYEKLIEIINSGTDEFIKSLPEYEKLLIKELKKELANLETSAGGKIKNTADNRKIIASLDSKMLEIMKKIGYQSQVFKLLANFDDIDNSLQSIHKDNNITVAQSLIDPIKQVLIDTTTNNLLKQGLDANLTQPIKDILLLNATVGTSLTDTIQQIDDSMTTIPGRKGAFYSHSTQVARDTLGQYNGAINQAIKDEFELDGNLYIGSLVEDSRPQCERWVEMSEIPDSELQNEIDWAFANGSGMILGTTASNFCTNRGGYNCRHIVIPTKIKK
jgi:hypothetical protein